MLATERLLRIASDRNSACCLRSSGTRPMPARMASIGERIATSRPSTSTRPRCIGSAPKMARASSVRPAPTRPARPRISPLRTSRLTSWSMTACGSRASRPRETPSTASATAPAPEPSRCANRRSISRPTIRRMMPLDVELARRRRSPTRAPSRSTVTRSQIRITSSSRWVTKTTEMPLALSPRTIANRRWTSLSDRAEVGSSMTTSLAVHRQRAGDLDHLLLGDREVGDQAARVDVEADLRGQRPGAAVQLAPSRRGPTRTGSAADEHVLGDRERRDQVELLVDRDDAQRLRRVRAGEADLGAVEGDACRHRAPGRRPGS